MVQFGPYTIPNKKLEECIIVATKNKDGDIVLAKNRDRMYDPKFKVVHMIKKGVEIAFWYDEDTGWAEGLNEFGIGLVNTALMVDFDEKEKKIAKKTGQKSEDGERIIAALGEKTVEDALEVAIKHNTGIKGHTFISDAKGNAYKIEATKNHKHIEKKINTDKVTVRTNHGLDHPDAGYTKGKDRKSSELRMKHTEELVSPKKHTDEEILDILKTQKFEKHSPLNMRRDTKKMSTTSQIALNLTKRILTVHALKGKSNFTGIDNKLPKGYKPKIKIKVKTKEV